MKRILITAFLALSVSGTSAMASALITVNADGGKVIAASDNGLTLYTFRKDKKNRSNCYGDCATAWPPYLAPSSAKASGALGVIKRKDGTRQYALNGKPLYFWAGDSARGDVNGDGVGGVWDAVRKGG